jgi:hypothetical protein
VKHRLQQNGRAGHILSTDEALRMNLFFQEVFEAFSNEKNHVIINNGSDHDIERLVREALQ